jgi:DNA-binding NtrC family response regulator
VGNQGVEECNMHVLIVEEHLSRGQIWKQFLERQGATVCFVSNSDAATEALNCRKFDALVINIAMANAAVLAVSDLAGYKNPDIAIITVTSGSFFSDGSIFKLIPNVYGCVGGDVLPKDLVDIVSHYASKAKRDAQAVRPTSREIEPDI